MHQLSALGDNSTTRNGVNIFFQRDVGTHVRACARTNTAQLGIIASLEQLISSIIAQPIVWLTCQSNIQINCLTHSSLNAGTKCLGRPDSSYRFLFYVSLPPAIVYVIFTTAIFSKRHVSAGLFVPESSHNFQPTHTHYSTLSNK